MRGIVSSRSRSRSRITISGTSPTCSVHLLPRWSPVLLSLSLCLLVLLLIAPVPSHSFRPIPPTPASPALRSEASSDKTSAVMARNDNDSASKPPPLSVGFIGCGTIASSIARGLVLASKNGDGIGSGSGKVDLGSIVVSRRSESRSEALARDHGELVSVTEDNQEILDRCDLVFLTVLPQQASPVLRDLSFDPDRHVLVSLVSTANLEDLVRDSGLGPSSVSKMICLPSIANHKGVALLCCGETTGPTKDSLVQLFGAMGGVVALDTEADLEACMVTTCTMGPLYGTMKNQRDWLLKKTGSLSKEDATFLVIKQFAGAISDAESATMSSGGGGENSLETRLEDLIEEQTPGGLNEQALKNYGRVLGGFENLQQPVMDAILSRIRGETDGNIEKK